MRYNWPSQCSCTYDCTAWERGNVTLRTCILHISVWCFPSLQGYGFEVDKLYEVLLEIRCLHCTHFVKITFMRVQLSVLSYGCIIGCKGTGMTSCWWRRGLTISRGFMQLVACTVDVYVHTCTCITGNLYNLVLVLIWSHSLSPLFVGFTPALYYYILLPLPHSLGPNPSVFPSTMNHP